MERQRYFDIVDSLYGLHKAKSDDYGSEREYFPFGQISYIQMLHVKTKRLVTLAQETDGNINFESIEDTVKDLTNYCIFFLDFLERVRDE